MNRLEEYIRDHKNLFDEEPATGHFERLQQKMTRKPAKTIALRWSISIAASIAILLSAGIMWQNSSKQNGTMICENAIDLRICYLDKMNVVANQIEMLIRDFDFWEQQEVMNDVQNIIISVDNDFESELPEELPDHIAKEILADYYRQNLEGLEMIAQLVVGIRN